MFAPRHHAAMRHVVGVRKELAVRTIFNFLGPLTNPAGASRQLLGVSNRRYQETIAEALVGLGCERALVVCADDGLDEISIGDRTRVIEVADGGTEEWFIEPEAFGLERAPIEAIAGGEPSENASVVRSVFAGEPGPARDIVVINAAAAIVAAGGAADLAEGIDGARRAIDDGAATAVLGGLVELTTTLTGG
jgi:anthranilate phosphoribosyltransferase